MPFPPPAGTFQFDSHGIDLVRSRDCVVFVKDDTFPVRVDGAMLQAGWPGGQGVQWVDVSSDHFTVTYSTGLFGGFLVWGSDESADQHVSSTRGSIYYGDAVLFAGSPLLSTSSYEQFTYASRLGGPPFIPLAYAPNDPLYFSLRGLWTKEDELSLSGSGLAPAVSVGWVTQTPQTVNQFFLGIQATL
jgi:hypothetical protein